MRRPLPSTFAVQIASSQSHVMPALWRAMPDGKAAAAKAATGAAKAATHAKPRGIFRSDTTAEAVDHQSPHAPALLLCQGGTRLQGVEDDADEESFEAAECFASALAFASFALEVGACLGVVAGLCDRNPVERGVELPVAAAVEPVPVA